jgi:hypothetical protein
LFGQGAGLLGQGYTVQQGALAPFTSQFSTAQGLEQAAQQPMDIGTALGQKVTTANTNAANTMLAGQSAAGNLQRQAATAQAQQLAGMGQGISNLGTMYGMGMFSPTTTTASNQGMQLGVDKPTMFGDYLASQ